MQFIAAIHAASDRTRLRNSGIFEPSESCHRVWKLAVAQAAVCLRAIAIAGVSQKSDS
jgi:hypothetical protein